MYPLKTMPLSLCKIDGEMNSTLKDKLTEHLEKKITSEISPFLVYFVIDGMVFLEEDYLCNLVIYQGNY